MSESDEALIDRIMAHEGSTFTNDAADSGGPTKFGITQAVMSAWLGRRASIHDVETLSRDEAVWIYRAQYIRPFDGLRDPLRGNVIDMGVNAGVRRATILLQQMVGATVDAWVGPETRHLADSFDPAAANALYCGFRLAFYENLIVEKPSQMKFRRGWRARALSFLPPTA